MHRPFVLTSLSIAIVASLACSASTPPSASQGDGGSNPTANCGKPGRDGRTESTNCKTCSAGQYCSTAGNYKCVPGCTSDDNCGENERCVRCGTSTIGTCQSCTRSDEDTCNVPTRTCERNTDFDDECASPGKAYECPESNIEPQDAGACVAAEVSRVFCCGGGTASKCTRQTQLDTPICMGKKAFSCPPNEEPSGTCKLGVDGMTYCCD